MIWRAFEKNAFFWAGPPTYTIPGNKILETTKANTILAHTIQQFALATCMKRYQFENYQEPASLALL
jgi:hypothetical protein